MSKLSDFNDILEECLERVLKGEPIEACLADHPGHAGELEPLLKTALEARAASSVLPRQEFRQRAALQFQSALREMPAKQPAGPVFWQRRWMGVLAGLAFVLLAGTGVVAASNSSLPGESLYSVKLATESVRIALASSDIDKAELYVKFTDRRVDEIIAMADQGDLQQMEKATERLNSQMVAMAGLTAPEGYQELTIASADKGRQPLMGAPAPTTIVPGTTALAPTRSATTVTATTTPAPTTTAPPPVTQTTVPTLASTTAASVTPPAATTDAGAGPPQEATNISMVPPPAAAEGSGQEDGSVLTDQEQLRALLERSAALNSRALLEELETAPESVREALERALLIASTGYNQNISNLAP
jgi:hypothetical protein